MRRSDREVKDVNEKLEILENCEVVRLALSDDGQPYVFPLYFGYEMTERGLTLYFHSAMSGRKVDIIKANPRACFECDRFFRTVEDSVPCKWTAEHESLIGFGTVTVIETSGEKKKAMDSIMHRYGYEGAPVYNEELFAKTMFYKMEVSEFTGKRRLLQ